MIKSHLTLISKLICYFLRPLLKSDTAIQRYSDTRSRSRSHASKLSRRVYILDYTKENTFVNVKIQKDSRERRL